MKQQFIQRFTTGQTYYPAITGGSVSGTTTQSEVTTVIPPGGAGIFRRFRIKPRIALTGAQTRTFTIRKGTPGTPAATALVIVINAASGLNWVTDTTNNISFAAGDSIVLHSTSSGSPGATVIDYAIEYEATVPDTSLYAFGTMSIMTTGPSYSALFGGIDYGTDNTQDVVAVGGTIVGMSYHLSSAPGAGDTRIWTVMKGGIAQDGGGGTTDTRLTIADTATVGSVSLSYPLVAGNQTSVRYTSTGTPASSRGVGSICFVSGTPNTWNLCGTTQDSLTGTSTLYSNVLLRSAGNWVGTETLYDSLPLTSMWLYGMRGILTTAPGASKSWTITLRKSGVDTAQTITFLNTTSEITSGIPVAFVDGDIMTLKGVPANTPASSGPTCWGFIATDVDPTLSGEKTQLFVM